MRVWSLKMAIFASFCSLFSEHFTYMAAHSFHVMRLSMTLAIFEVIILFHIKFLVNDALYGKSYLRLITVDCETEKVLVR